MRPFPVLVASVVLLGATPDCATLPTLDVCGNGLLDPGEDCDGPAGLPPDVHCAAPAQQNACRYTCNVKDASKGCPTGYACSTVDGVCRTPKGTFTPLTPVAFNADHAAVADFDGDGVEDVFASQGAGGALQANMYFFAAGGTVAAQTGVPPVSFGAGGRLTGKSAADLVGFLSNAGGDTGMLVMKGGASRSLLPASFSSFPFADDAVRFLPFYAPGTGLVALRGASVVGYNVTYGSPQVLRNLGQPPSPDGGRAGYLGDALHGGLRLGLARTHAVDVYDFESSYKGAVVTTVSLPDPSTVIKDFWFSHYDADALLDLVVLTGCGGAKMCAGERIFVAYGTGDGKTLALTPGGAGSSSPTAVDVKYTGLGDVLGVENLLGKPSGEVIRTSGVTSYTPPGKLMQAGWSDLPITLMGTASEAVMADFNHDGRFDVMVALAGTSQLEFLLNAGAGQFNTAVIPLAGTAEHLVVGDFDGDLFPDVAFSEAIDSSTANVGFLFGGPGAEPAGPLEVGPFSPVSQVVASPNILNGGATSRTDLLAVTGTGADAHLAVFPGSANRQLYSPWFFVPKGSSAPLPPMSAALGAFSGAGQELAALLVSYPPELCLLESTQGTLNQPKGPVHVPPDIDGYAAGIVTLAGHAGSTDELAVVGQTSASPPRGVLAVAQASGGAFAFPGSVVKFDPAPLVADAQSFMVGGVGGMGGPVGGVPIVGNSVPTLPSCAADLDGDGQTDLAVVGDGATRSLLVAWRGAGGFAAPTPILKSAGVSPDWLACIRTSAGAAVAVLEGSEVRVVQCGGAKGRTCAVGAPVARAGVTMLAPVGGTTASPRIAVGDLTGDGLDDVVLTGFNLGIQIFAAEPTIP